MWTKFTGTNWPKLPYELMVSFLTCVINCYGLFRQYEKTQELKYEHAKIETPNKGLSKPRLRMFGSGQVCFGMVCLGQKYTLAKAIS